MTAGVIPSFRFFVPDSSDFNVGVDWAGANFTGADMTLTVFAPAAAGGATLLTASTDDGRIRIHDDGAGFDYFIPQSAIDDVPVGLQRVQQVVVQGGVTSTLFQGSWSKAVGAPPAASCPLVYDGFSAPIEFAAAPVAISLNTTGAPGDSAYELWLANGGRGTVQEFLASLQGPPGASSAAAITASGPDGVSTVQALLDSLQAQLVPQADLSLAPTYWLPLLLDLGLTAIPDVDYAADPVFPPNLPLALLLELVN